MDKRITDMNTLGSPDDLDLIEVVDVSEPLPSNQNKKFSLANLKLYITNALSTAAHKVTHVVGGTDAFVITDLLDAVARTIFRRNNVVVGTRRGLNFIEGTNTTIQVTDDSVNEKVDVTINAIVPAAITYTPNKALFGDSTTGAVSSYDSVERVVGQGVKITGESVFDTNLTASDPDFTFEVWKKTFNATTSTAGTAPQFQLLADGATVIHQFVRQALPDGVIPAGHSVQFLNNESNGVFITNQLGKDNGLILHEKASNVALGFATYSFDEGLQGTLATYLGETYIPKLKVGYDNSQGDKKWLDIYTPNYPSGVYTNDKVHLSTRRQINGSTVGVTDRPKLKISADEFIVGVMSNDVVGGNSEGFDTYRFTDKGLVFSGIVATTALNNSLFLDSGTGKLSFKDSLGNVNPLY